MLQNHHLDGLFPPIDEDGEVMPPGSYEPPKLVTLLLDSSKITDEAAAAISECRELRELHVAETRISSKLNLTTSSSMYIADHIACTPPSPLPLGHHGILSQAVGRQPHIMSRCTGDTA